MFHTRRVPSSPAVTMLIPEGLHIALLSAAPLVIGALTAVPFVASQICTVPSAAAVSIVLPLGAHAALRTMLGWLIVYSWIPSAHLQTDMVLSPKLTNRCPSGLHAAQVTRAPGAVNTASTAPLLASHNRIVLSLPVLKSIRLSGLQAILKALERCPWVAISCFPVIGSHTPISPLESAPATRCPSGLHAMLTVPLWPLNVEPCMPPVLSNSQV